MQKILITGITGFIGGAVLNKLTQFKKDYQIHALVRPQTNPLRYSQYSDYIEVVELDLSDTSGLTNYLVDRQYDTILHIGALRGGRKYPKSEYYLSNVVSTEVFIEYCLKRQCKLLFCSSVGVYGAIPDELPANIQSPKIADNYYHYTKIEAEKRINKAILDGLQAAILRPAITYGVGDYGFPFQLVKMIRQKRFPMVSKRTWIHLCHIDTISNAFIWLLDNEFDTGLTLNVADSEPVQLNNLVNFISRQLRNENYPKWLSLDIKVFESFERLFKLLKNELWISRVQLISKSWFYDVKPIYQVMNLKPHYTIPDIEVIIKAFKK